MTRGLAGIALCAAAAVATAQPLPEPVVERAAALRDAALAGNHAYATLESLLTEVGPRFPGTSGDQAAVAWALRTLPCASSICAANSESSSSSNTWPSSTSSLKST